MAPVFEWDDRKAKSNFSKHRVRFTEAISVFADPLAQVFPDDSHSAREPREIIIGHSNLRRLLLVSFTELLTGRIRIISARRTTRAEQRDYERHFPD